jgi:hypothetical protein
MAKPPAGSEPAGGLQATDYSFLRTTKLIQKPSQVRYNSHYSPYQLVEARTPLKVGDHKT